MRNPAFGHTAPPFDVCLFFLPLSPWFACGNGSKPCDQGQIEILPGPHKTPGHVGIAVPTRGIPLQIRSCSSISLCLISFWTKPCLLHKPDPKLFLTKNLHFLLLSHAQTDFGKGERTSRTGIWRGMLKMNGVSTTAPQRPTRIHRVGLNLIRSIQTPLLPRYGSIRCSGRSRWGRMGKLSSFWYSSGRPSIQQTFTLPPQRLRLK